jgi:hypothetical protein
MDDLSRLRWLARDVLPEALTTLSPDLPAPVLLSAHLTPAVREYVSWWIGHADPAGTFAAKTRWLRRLAPPLLLRILLTLGYDGLVYVKEDAIIGHVFFQRRSAAMHGFSTSVTEAFDGRGYSVVMMMDYVAYASQAPGIEKVRVGTGQNNVTRRLLQRIRKHEGRLGWNVGLDGWITFRADVRAEDQTGVGPRP